MDRFLLKRKSANEAEVVTDKAEMQTPGRRTRKPGHL